MYNLTSIYFMVRERFAALMRDESGVGVIELVLILVVLIGLVSVFKGSINTLLGTIFDSINSASGEIL